VPAGRQVGVARRPPQPALRRRRRAPHADVSAQSRPIGLNLAAVGVTPFTSRLQTQTPAVLTRSSTCRVTGTPAAIGSPAREGPMTTVLELVGAFLSATILLTAAMFLAAFQLGRLITRDDEQREVEVARAPKMAVYDLVMGTACSHGARYGTLTRRRAGAPGGRCSSRNASSPSSTTRWSRVSATAAR
jgi:hypothetical protein